MIVKLREQEEILLYGNVLRIPEREEGEVVEYLLVAYKSEAMEFPFVPPAFDRDAAAWGAKVVYIVAQLILYRKNQESELSSLLPGFPLEPTPYRILSADLCLRFLPDMLQQLKVIDAEDGLIRELEELLLKWHYSGINYPLAVEQLDFSVVSQDRCMEQLYTNRIVEYKRTPLAQHPAWTGLVQAQLGMYGQAYWKDFSTKSLHE